MEFIAIVIAVIGGILGFYIRKKRREIESMAQTVDEKKVSVETLARFVDEKTEKVDSIAKTTKEGLLSSSSNTYTAISAKAFSVFVSSSEYCMAFSRIYI